MVLSRFFMFQQLQITCISTRFFALGVHLEIHLGIQIKTKCIDWGFTWGFKFSKNPTDWGGYKYEKGVKIVVFLQIRPPIIPILVHRANSLEVPVYRYFR